MNDKVTTGMDATVYYDNERRLESHSPYQDVSQTPSSYGIQMQQCGGAIQPMTVVVEEPFVWNWCTLVTSVVAFFLCPFCGFPGTVLSLLSYTDHQSKNYNNAKSKKSMALCCGISGIVAFVLWVALLIGFTVYALSVAQQSTRNYNG